MSSIFSEVGTMPYFTLKHWTGFCEKCDKCIDNCSTNSLKRNEKGRIIQDFSKCIECLKCTDNCKYLLEGWSYGEK